MKLKNSKRIPVTGDWPSSFEGGFVEVSVHNDGMGVFRVAVWGDDDYGFEKNFKSRVDALGCFNGLSECSAEGLYKLGFIRA